MRNYFIIVLIFVFFDTTGNIQNEKRCRYRDFGLYDEENFRYTSGAGCYNFTNPDWAVGGKLIGLSYSEVGIEEKMIVPYIFVGNVPVKMDYTDEVYTDIIKTLFIDIKYYEKWELCAKTAMECCLKKQDDNNIYPSDSYPCPAIWDGLTCWGKTEAETSVREYCATYLTEADDFKVCRLKSKRFCLKYDWNHTTDYVYCAESYTYRKRHTFHIISLSVAIALMFPSLVIYFSYKKLKILRIVMHRNLILSIFIKNILVIISKNLVILDAIAFESNGVMEENSAWCRILAFIENLSKNFIFTLMLADGFYLHKLIVRAFKNDPDQIIMYIIIVVASILPSTVWAILMLVNEKDNCWMADSESWFQWITDGYKYATLVINLILLIDIIRVLLMKFGKSQNKKQTKTAFKAAVILLPIFGVPLLITSQRALFDLTDCVVSDVYYYTTYSIEALQGILLSLLFCYLSEEVHNEIYKTYRKCDLYIREKFNLPEKTRKSTRRRTTGITALSTGTNC